MKLVWDRDEARKATAEAAAKDKEKHERKEEDARRFATLNGWKWTDKTFTFRQLAKLPHLRSDQSPAMISGDAFGRGVIDHVRYFRDGARKPAAVVSQPYRHVTIEDARVLAHRYGFDVCESPVECASWHVPGSTRFFVLVPRGVLVRWLPEQERQTTSTSPVELASVPRNDEGSCSSQEEER